jgi:hypothetical protein
LPNERSMSGNGWGPELDTTRCIIAQRCFINYDMHSDRLARRGGLAPDECLAVLENRRWMPIEAADAQIQLVKVVSTWQKNN